MTSWIILTGELGVLFVGDLLLCGLGNTPSDVLKVVTVLAYPTGNAYHKSM